MNVVSNISSVLFGNFMNKVVVVVVAVAVVVLRISQ